MTVKDLYNTSHYIPLVVEIKHRDILLDSYKNSNRVIMRKVIEDYGTYEVKLWRWDENNNLIIYI